MARPRATLAERIVDAALKRADKAGWAHVRFHDIAGDLKISLAEVYATYADLDAVGDALLSRADRAMLEASAERGFARKPARARLSIVITRWLDALAPHRRIVGEMLRYKFQPAHVHLQAALVVRLSRTVQWVREAARLDAAGRRRQIEEMGLTALFMATVMVWLTDTSEGQQRTRAILERRLASADRLMARLWPPEP